MKIAPVTFPSTAGSMCRVPVSVNVAASFARAKLLTSYASDPTARDRSSLYDGWMLPVAFGWASAAEAASRHAPATSEHMTLRIAGILVMPGKRVKL
jgi:hypothetical protein